MCRAVWIVVVAPDDDACKMLRRAAGPDAQVVGMATNVDEARALLASTPADVLVVDAATPDAESLRDADAAFVLVGAGERDVESAITRALIARRRA